MTDLNSLFSGDTFSLIVGATAIFFLFRFFFGV